MDNFVVCKIFHHYVVSGPNPLQLVSFHSISKGFLGECGLRGGYLECLGFPEEVEAQIYKLCSLGMRNIKV